MVMHGLELELDFENVCKVFPTCLPFVFLEHCGASSYGVMADVNGAKCFLGFADLERKLIQLLDCLPKNSICISIIKMGLHGKFNSKVKSLLQC